MKALDDTIAAIATAPGEGAIAIVRASGREARALGETLLRDRQGKSHRLEGKCVRWGRVVTPHQEEPVDEVLALWMPGPESYTREDVLEFQCHGGQAAGAAILDLLLENGARLAEPGEFTLRAFLGGRIDLVQAEAVLDTVRAETGESLRAHEELLEGKLSAEVGRWQALLGKVLAEIEARLDFAEEDVGTIDARILEARLEEVRTAMEDKLSTFSWGRVSREGFRVALVGAPNTGKSSLLNRLAEGDHAMVSHLAGTTRDIIEVRVNALGVPARLIDTAGLRGSDDPLEAEGVRRAKRAAEGADLVLLVCDGSRELSEDEVEEGRRLAASRPILAVVNKVDLGDRPATRLRDIFRQPALGVSALTGEGIGGLLVAIRDFAWKGEGVRRAAPLTRVRHRKAVEEAKRFVDAAVGALQSEAFLELVAREIQGARSVLRDLLGWGTPEEVLTEIFEEFCIGK